MKKMKIKYWIYALAVIFIIAGVNFFTSSKRVRLDLTEDGIYSLSNQTKNILHSLKDIVTIRLYFSSKMPPALLTAQQQVIDITEEFKKNSGGNIKVERVDPSLSQFDEQKAALMGINPFELTVVEQDKQELTKVYFGMTVLYGEKHEVIPLIQGVGNLEYSTLQAIIKLTSDSFKNIAWIESSKEDMTYEIVKHDLKQRYNLTEIKSLNEIKNLSIDALVLISPREWTVDEQKVFDKFVIDGGNVLMLADRYLIDNSLKVSELKVSVVDILKKYGVDILPEFVIDNSNAMAAFSGGQVTYRLPYPYWVLVRNNQVNSKMAWLDSMDAVVLPWTSPLITNGNTQIMLTSSKNSMNVSYPFDLDPHKSSGQLVNEDGKESVLVAEINKISEAYFNENKKEKGVNSGKIIIVGDSYFASDFFIQQFVQNLIFFSNMTDSLLMGDMLSGIRAKSSNMRPIVTMSDGAKMVLRYANVIINPLLIIIFGIGVWIYRKSMRRRKTNLAS